MSNNNDNRMGGIRNLEALASGCQQYTVKYELGSECKVPGLLNYADGNIICTSMGAEASGTGFGSTTLFFTILSALTRSTGKHMRKGTTLRTGYLLENIDAVQNADEARDKDMR